MMTERGALKADRIHRLAEFLAVFRLLDHVRLGADHLDAVFFKDAGAFKIERAIERRLPAHGRQDRVGAFSRDDLLDEFDVDRLDIGRVGEIRIGHDRRRVRIDEDDAIAFLLQRLDRLHAGIIELAGLPDDDRPGADDEDRRNIGAFGHLHSRAGAPGAAGSARRAGSTFRLKRSLRGDCRRGEALSPGLDAKPFGSINIEPKGFI